MKITFWGVRGSIPAPTTSAEIRSKIKEVLGSAVKEKLNDEEKIDEFLSTLPSHLLGTTGGNTSCVEVRTSSETIVLDAGTGIRPLGFKLMTEEFAKGEGTISLFLSHTHWDHIMGFPFFIPAYIKGNSINIYGCHPDLEDRFRNQHNPLHFPVHLESLSADLNFESIKVDQTISIGDCSITPTALHHPGGSFGYCIEHDGKKIIYATDSEYKDLTENGLKKYLEFYHDCDVLIFDAMYTLSDALEKEDWGHSSSLIGAEISMQSNAKKLVLFHHDPVHDDEALEGIVRRTTNFIKKNSEQPCEVILAHEGLVLEI